MGSIASQITSLTIVYSTVYSDADQKKNQSCASLAFVRGIHRGPVNSPHKCPVTRKMFPFDDVIMFIEYFSQIWWHEPYFNIAMAARCLTLSSQVTGPKVYNGCFHDDVMKWKHFPRNWPFVRGIHRSTVNSPHKGQWRGALMFSLIGALNKQLYKQSLGPWFETPMRSLRRHCNVS